MATQYVQVKVKKEQGGSYTVRLRVIADDSTYLRGFEINKEGEEVLKGDASKFHIIHRNDILKRTPLRMNLHYGELEPDTEWGTTR